MLKYLFTFFTLSSFIGSAQTDSVAIILNSSEHDTVKVKKTEVLIGRDGGVLKQKLVWCKELQDFAIEKGRRDILARAYFLFGTTITQYLICIKPCQLQMK